MPPPRPRGVGAMLMPDGRSLAAVLAAAERGAPPVRRRPPGGAASSLEAQWRRGEARPRAAAVAPAPAAAAADDGPALRSGAGAPGRSKRSRASSDRLLRDLAGPLDFESIAGLFQPSPFGVATESALARVAADPDAAAVWDNFRSCDADRQDRALAAWEEQVRRPPRGRARAGAAAGLAAWGRVDPAARAAFKREFKRGGACRLAEMEAPLRVAAGGGGDAATTPVRLPGETPYSRLIARGLAAFYGARAARDEGWVAVFLSRASALPPAAALADVVAALDAPAGAAAALRDALAALAWGAEGGGGGGEAVAA